MSQSNLDKVKEKLKELGRTDKDIEEACEIARRASKKLKEATKVDWKDLYRPIDI